MAGLTGAAAGVSSITAGCASSDAKPTGKPVRIGMVSNQTGSLAGFGEADSVVIANLRQALKDSIQINGTTYPLEIQLRDTGSQPDRAAAVATDLIENAKVDLLLAAGAPEIVNPAADQAERHGMPFISTNVPWQAWFLGRQAADLDKGKPPHQFTWTYHFFWGLEDIVTVYGSIWQQVANNRVVGAVFTNDADGDAWVSDQTGLRAHDAFGKDYSFVYLPRPDDGANAGDYDKLIRNFKDRDAQILTGVISPADFATLWHELDTQGFRPPVATVAKALLFPAFLEVLSPSPVGLTSEVWWHPAWPFKSSLTGLTAAQWAAEYTRQTHRQWTQPIGSVHALFEVAISVLQRAGVGDPRAIVGAIQDTSLDTIIGHLSWKQGHDKGLLPIAAKNVAKTPVVGGQWTAATSGPFRFDLQIVTNPGHPNIPVTRTVRPLSQT